MAKKWKIGLGVAAAVLLAVGAYLAVGLKGISVDMVPVTAGELAVTVRGTGDIKAADPLSVAAETGGRVTAVAVEEGDRVTAGDLLVALDTGPMEDGLARLTAERRALQAQLAEVREQSRVALRLTAAALEQAQTELERMETLHAAAAVSDRDLEMARLAYEKAVGESEQAEAAELTADSLRAQVEAVDASVRQAERELGRARITAPQDGVVLWCGATKGVVIGPGTPLISLGNPEALTVEARVEPRDAALVQAGQAVRVTHLTGGGAVAEGEVTLVPPAGVTTVSALGVKEAKAAVEIRVTKGMEQLKPGYEVNVEVIIDQIQAPALVPEAAVFRRAGESHVFTVDSGRARLIKVTTGYATGGRVEVTEGLDAGDTVIADPPAEVKDGTRVR